MPRSRKSGFLANKEFVKLQVLLLCNMYAQKNSLTYPDNAIKCCKYTSSAESKSIDFNLFMSKLPWIFIDFYKDGGSSSTSKGSKASSRVVPAMV